MNYLQLCQRAHLILRIGDETPGTEPQSVVSQKKVLAELVQWIAAAEQDIIRLHENWLFLNKPGSFVVPSGTHRMTLANIVSAVSDWNHIQPFVGADYGFLLIRPTDGTAEQEVRFIVYEEWYGRHDVAPIPEGQPSFFTVTPTGDIEFDTTTEREYTVRCNYRKNAPVMTANDSVPTIPESAHLTIVWWAIVNYYCTSRDGTDKMAQKAGVNLRRELTAMRNKYLPAFTLG